MKRAFLALASLLVCTIAQAQMVDPTAPLKAYATKALPRCPGGALTLEPVTVTGPANFNAYAVTLRSTDKYCGGQKFLLHAPASGQIIIGSVLPLPQDARPADVRVAEASSQALSKQISATVSPLPLQDGLKSVTITYTTPFGPFSYKGYVDGREQFLIVGTRGNLKTEPSQSLREALGIGASTARKGNRMAKLEIIEFSDFQCPTCARAHEKVDPLIEKNLNKVNYLRFDLPLFEHHQWAIPAAMGARAIQRVAPAKYWAYVDHVFKNQESITKLASFDKFLQEYAEDHDIDWAAINKIYSSKAERQVLLDQVSKAFSLGIAATPTFMVNGQLMGFGPDGTFTVDAIKKALGVPVAAAAPAPSK